MKAIIIGAGIAGLTAAHALQQAGMEVAIYDKATELKNIGGGILIWPHGLRYLAWMDLEECFKPFYTHVKGCKVIGICGNEILNAEYSELYKQLGGEVLPIERSLFQKILHCQLKSGLLQLNKECIAVENHPDRVKVIFADGTSDEADLLVAADGIHSAVRKQIFPDIVANYTGTSWWGGIIEQKHASYLPTEEVYFGIGEGKVCIVWPTAGKNLLWCVAVKIAEEDLSFDNGDQQLEQICEGWHDDIKKLVSSTKHQQRFQVPICSFSANHLQSNRIVLLGDAAQTLGPILAQGASRAIEDAYVLANCIFTHGHDINAALTYYESIRFKKYARLYELENQTAELMVNDNLISLHHFEEQMQQIDLITMYQELIPLVNEQACLESAQLGKQRFAEAS